MSPLVTLPSFNMDTGKVIQCRLRPDDVSSITESTDEKSCWVSLRNGQLFSLTISAAAAEAALWPSRAEP